MKKRVIIVGNGKVTKAELPRINANDYVIGVDRAAYWLIQAGRTPNAAIGDFDSVTRAELATIRQAVKTIRTYNTRKDWTDMELAVRYAVSLKPSEVIIVGGMGSRMDHTIATWHLLDLLLIAKIPHILLNETNSVRLIGIGRTILVSGGGYKYVSVLPYSDSISLSLSGFRYELPKTKLIRGTTRGISNELSGRKAIIRIFEGKAWVIESNDE